MNIICQRKEDTSVTYEQIVELIHESFRERLEQGLNFACSFMNADEFKKDTENSIVLVAIAQETQELVGTSCLCITQDKKGQKYGYKSHLAIKADKKRLGIGQALEEYIATLAKEYGCSYIDSNTAVGAKSSVKFHKNNGYRIIGLKSWSTTNYYSYLFRKQLCSVGGGIIATITMDTECGYSFIKTFLARKRNGEHRAWLKLVFNVTGMVRENFLK